MKFTLLFFASVCAFGAEPAFEVASIKPNTSTSGMIRINRPDDGGLTTENTTLRILMKFAYDVRDTQLIGGPTWLDQDRWDVVGKPETVVPRTPEGRKLVGKMLQKLLAERFGLVVHEEIREQPVYALLVAKSGSKLRAAKPDGQGMMQIGMGSLNASKLPLANLARALSDQLGRTVSDETGLTGDFDFTLNFSPEPSAMVRALPGGGGHTEGSLDPDRPSLFTAVQEQLGLRLESRKAPVPVIVIDKVERAAAN